ncbi:Acyl-CoA synthetase (AMP-forming)/AMP-acid ligase II [Desulfacinum infernum DSM 9756]|uniref:Acyl-CoA synthetase (AMP-forming)/AMP-acid ligase II n=1 Tax=Desulfacinum infernum DSM 9756 TaxID=1121391 RepID=A0A1M5ILR6_9BACT|nr:long-chain fatty acid--CoA ligase [Desulfacinum infernum]SHG29268.1 Acyl-CoA synthetase (AMP-forming)/AMP-acid ligase II [Desulfacinum infernum DSM 9756]
MRINIGGLLANRAFLSPDLVACVDDDCRYTFREVNQRANRFAHYLSAMGLCAGDRIAVLSRNREAVTTALFGAAKIGVVTVLLNWRLTAPELDYILGDCGARLLLYESCFGETVSGIRTSGNLEFFVSANGASPDEDFSQVLEKSSTAEPAHLGGGADPAIIMYTSGTTGKPKGAVISHDNVFWASIGLTHTLRWAHKDRYLLVAPLFHIGGLAPIFANVHVGCTTYYMAEFHPGKVWETLVLEKIQFLMTVPLMLQAMLMLPGIEKLDLSTFRHFICGGSPVLRSLIEKYRDLGLRVVQVYGATEYTGAITFWTEDMGLERASTAGKPIFHGAVKAIEPGSGREVPPGEVGELCLYGPQVFSGYWQNPEATRDALLNGAYRSGDLGTVDEEGFVTVVDRLKDMIISGGENIYPAEVEAVLSRMPQVQEVAVVGRPDATWGEVPVAHVVTRPGQSLTKEEVVDFCRKHLAGFKCVKDVVFTESLPKNATGKILKQALRQEGKGEAFHD